MAIPLSSTPAGGSPLTGDAGPGRDPLSIPPEVKASIKIILLVDERTLRESCASVLQMDGFSVTLAGRAEEAVEMVRRRKFDILLVDVRTLRESCASVLQMDGFSVTLAGRAEEAVEMVRRRKFDIVLVDLYMSQISGLKILRATLDANRDTIVVVMTGNPSVTTSIEALRAGAWDYLPKPFSATHLQVLIGRASHAVMMSREANT